jgi:hypothetical protein
MLIYLSYLHLLVADELRMRSSSRRYCKAGMPDGGRLCSGEVLHVCMSTTRSKRSPLRQESFSEASVSKSAAEGAGGTGSTNARCVSLSTSSESTTTTPEITPTSTATAPATTSGYGFSQITTFSSSACPRTSLSHTRCCQMK